MRRQRAAEQRESVAHGFSRGLKVKGFEARSGERKAVWKAGFYRPIRGLWLFYSDSTAYAVGYCLPPLRGWPPRDVPKADLRPARGREFGRCCLCCEMALSCRR